MPLEIGATIWGTVIEVSERGMLVSLPDGQTGRVPTDASLDVETLKARFAPGHELSFRVVALTPGEPLTLGLPAAEGEAETPFDQEFHRLNHALANRAVGSRYEPHSASTVEQDLEAWVEQASQSLVRLRKHRGERLSEEFYDENE